MHGTLFRDPEWEHPERAVNEINDAHRRVFTRYVEEQLQDRPELIERVLPEYPPFAKRMLLDNGWFRTIKKPHVDLIPEHLAKVEGNTLSTSSGETVEADVIILATGFQTTNVLGSYDIVGNCCATIGAKTMHRPISGRSFRASRTSSSCWDPTSARVMAAA